jgi:DHA1 family bicyclomycin/chloramphenicol resistance-like MFS transporter
MSTIALSKLKERPIPAKYSMAAITFVLAALSWVGPFSIDAYLPSLPAIGESLGASAAQVQQTVTAFLVSFAIMSLWHGAISDAYGRRRLTLICLGIFALASAGCALAGNIHVLMVFRMLQGATAGAGMVVGRAVVRDIYEGAAAQRLMSHIATIFTIAPVMAPLVGGWLQVWLGWRSVFAFLVLLAIFLWLSCWRALPETLPRSRRQRLEPAFLARSYWKVLTAPPFLMASLSMAFANAGMFIYIVGAPVFLMKHLGLKETEFLWLFLPISIALVIGAWISGRCAGKISGRGTIFAGYAVTAVAAIGNVLMNLVVPPAVPWSLVPIFFYVMGMAIAMPSLTLLGLDLFPLQRGLAASCQGFISLGFNSIVSALVAFTWATTLTMALTELMMFGAAILTIYLYIRTVRHFRIEKEPV